MNQLNQVELAFIVDTTGSMGAFINAARRQMIEMPQALTNEAGVAIDLRVAVVEFRDHPPQDHTFVTREHPFTDNLTKVQQTINSLRPDGGGDWPEAVYDGIEAAGELLSWRAHSRRIAILVGDAPPHGSKHPQDTCTCGLTAEKVSAIMEEYAIVLYGLGLTNDVAQSFSWLAHYTGGEYFEAAQGDAAIKALKTLLTNEFRDLTFDQQVLTLCQNNADWTVDELCERLESPRGRISASLSRLGRRKLLTTAILNEL
jgi:Mg-chelatase subunit ChlD